MDQKAQVFVPSRELQEHTRSAAKHARRDILGIVKFVNQGIKDGKLEQLPIESVLVSATLSVFFGIIVEHSQQKDSLPPEAVSHYVNVLSHSFVEAAGHLGILSDRKGGIVQ